MGKQGAIERRVRQLLLALTLLMALGLPQGEHAQLALAIDDPRAATGEWGGLINWGIFGKHMAMLPNGKVLAWPTGHLAATPSRGW